jgi:hypothetical protein
MMVTNRTPINRPAIAQITPTAVELFKRMQAVPPGDEWWTLHGELHRELQLKPWQWPAIEGPDEVNTYPASSAGGKWFARAQKLYRELEAMAA